MGLDEAGAKRPAVGPETGEIEDDERGECGQNGPWTYGCRPDNGDNCAKLLRITPRSGLGRKGRKPAAHFVSS
jgi:hypothetical protein